MESTMAGSPVHANSKLNMHSFAEIFCTQHAADNIQAAYSLEPVARA
jgi:hypothetical protein